MPRMWLGSILASSCVHSRDCFSSTRWMHPRTYASCSGHAAPRPRKMRSLHPSRPASRARGLRPAPRRDGRIRRASAEGAWPSAARPLPNSARGESNRSPTRRTCRTLRPHRNQAAQFKWSPLIMLHTKQNAVTAITRLPRLNCGGDQGLSPSSTRSRSAPTDFCSSSSLESLAGDDDCLPGYRMAARAGLRRASSDLAADRFS